MPTANTKFDYTLKLINGSKSATIGYQEVLKKLDIENEIYQGRPLTNGGTPQALFVKSLFEKMTPGLKVEVYFNGNLIL